MADDVKSRLRIVARHVQDVTVLVLSGDILVDDGDLAFRDAVHALVEANQVKIVVDLGGLSHIDSSGIGMFVAKQKTVREKGGDLRLVHLTSRSQRLLSSMKLTSIFQMFDDEASAVRSFS